VRESGFDAALRVQVLEHGTGIRKPAQEMLSYG
jgi:hypothetical protein